MTALRQTDKLPPYQECLLRSHGGITMALYNVCKNQGLCGLVPIFQHVPPRIVVQNHERNPKLEIDLSEQYILSCGNVEAGKGRP